MKEKRKTRLGLSKQNNIGVGRGEERRGRDRNASLVTCIFKSQTPDFTSDTSCYWKFSILSGRLYCYRTQVCISVWKEETSLEGRASGRGRSPQTAGGHKAISAKKPSAAAAAAPAAGPELGSPWVRNGRRVRVYGLSLIFLDIRLALAYCT